MATLSKARIFYVIFYILQLLVVLIFAGGGGSSTTPAVPAACASITSTGLQRVCITVASVCTGVRNLIPPVALLMIMGSAVVYAGGQFTGAETRARANVWSTNMLVGAIMGLIIATVGPAIINQLWQSSSGSTTSINC